MSLAVVAAGAPAWAGTGSPSGTAYHASGGTHASAPSHKDGFPHVNDDRPVVVVGIAGLRWGDLSAVDTPALWRFVAESSTASLSVRAVRMHTCPLDGWLTLGAGVPATAYRPGGAAGTACPKIPEPSAGRVPGFTEHVAYNRRFGYAAMPGALHQALERAGRCATAVGPGAAVALADDEGRVGGYVPRAADLTPSVLSRCPLTVVDLGTLPEGAGRAERLREAEAQFARLASLARPPARVLLAGLADSRLDRLDLRVLALRGPYPAGGQLTSGSTRQPGMALLSDLGPTVLGLLGVPGPPGWVGSLVRPAGPGVGPPEERVAALVEANVAARVSGRALPPFFVLTALAQLLAYGYALLRARRRSAARLARAAGALAGAAPVATFLADLLPWWRAPAPGWALAGAITLWAVVVAVGALAGPWRRHPYGPAGFVAAVTLVVLGADVVAGSRLQLSSVLGLSPLIGGRYYGFGNIAFAVFAMAALFTAAWAASAFLPARRAPAAAAVGVVGLVAVVLDGWPAFGSDFGGVLALIPGIGLLAFAAAGWRLAWGRVALLAAGAAAAVTAIAVLDWLRPPAQRSHLGQFVQAVLDGEALRVITRKAEANLAILQLSWAAWLVPVVYVLLAYLLAWPDRYRASALAEAYARVPLLRSLLLAGYVTAVVGCAVNDSGVIVPAVALAAALPLAVLVVAGGISGASPGGGGGPGRVAPARPRGRARPAPPW